MRAAKSPKLPTLGATVTPRGVRFALFTTTASRASVRLYDSSLSASASGAGFGTVALDPLGGGFFSGEVAGIGPGALYTFVLDDRELPDPYARFLPRGVHGPARVEPPLPPPARRRAPAHARTRPSSLDAWVLYELHVGTFTPAGTYAAAMSRLDHIAGLGVTTIELMPIASFAGARGWGYDGVALFAPFAPYGSREELRLFVDAAHARGLSVVLDVVYNHFGPAGNYLAAYAPEYFTDAYTTKWGAAPSFAFPAMRRLVLDNVRHWLEELDFDGLRLDATQDIFDVSTPHVLSEIGAIARSFDPPRVIIAEDDRNDPAVVTGHGLDGVWVDDFHHAAHVTLTAEDDGYYAAFRGGAGELARTIERGWLYEGQPWAPSGRPRGRPATLPKGRLVYCLQNHDQIGNRAHGDRLTASVGPEVFAGASALLLFLPQVPLLFMGQEWAASTPFLFFTDHEPAIGDTIAEGRRAEFAGFRAFDDPNARARIPDPQAIDTFTRSALDWDEIEREPHARILSLYRTLLRLRREDPVLGRPSTLAARAEGELLVVTRTNEHGERVLLHNAGDAPAAWPELADGFRILVTTSPPEGTFVAPRASIVFAREVRVARENR